MALAVRSAVVHHSQAFEEEVLEDIDGAPMGPRELALGLLRGHMAARLRNLEDQIVVAVELHGNRAHQLAAADGEHLVAAAQLLQFADGAEAIVLGDGHSAASLGKQGAELLEVDEAAVAGPGGEADVDDLDAELVVEVADAEQLRPEAFVGGEGIHAALGAHGVELCPKRGVLRDVVLVLGRELFQLVPERS